MIIKVALIVGASLLLSSKAAAEPVEVSLDGIESVELRSRTGDLRIVPAEDSKTMRITGGRARIETRRGQVVVVTRDDLTVHLPAVPSLSISVRSGDVGVRAATKRLRVSSVSGDVQIETTPLEEGGVESFSGDVRFVGDAERLTITAVSGSVDVRGDSRDARIKSTSGDVHMRSTRLPQRLDASTVRGDIDLQGHLQKGATFDLHTTSGDVRVRYIGDVAPHVYARAHKKKPSAPSTPAPTSGDGATLVVSTFSGDVRVERAD